MEDEVYNLVVKGNDLKTYIRRFQELAVLCPNMVPNSKKFIKVFIGGLPRRIEGNVTASKPQTLEEAITITQRLMEQAIRVKLVSTNERGDVPRGMGAIAHGEVGLGLGTVQVRWGCTGNGWGRGLAVLVGKGVGEYCSSNRSKGISQVGFGARAHGVLRRRCRNDSV
nr:reverse transcriptase domain-containing protein [Tanacetum cinerariifolium]